MFGKAEIPTRELEDFASKGIEYLLVLNEKAFIPWRSIMILVSLGTLQVVAGGILMATGYGLSIGMSIVAEGLSDLFTAYRAYSSRHFSWSDYAKQKSINIVISLVSAGYDKIKDVGKGVKTLVSEAGRETLEQAGTQFVWNSKSIGKEMIKTGENLKSITVKYIGVKTGEAVLREGLNYGVNYLSHMSLDFFKGQICQCLEERVKECFFKPELSSLVRKMFALDTLTKSKTNQTKIEKIVVDKFNLDRDLIKKKWDPVATSLINNVLCNINRIGVGMDIGFRIVATLNGLNSIHSIIIGIHDELVKQVFILIVI